MQNICPDEMCTGCQACYSVCPVDALSITPNYRGFYAPVIDQFKCTDCRLCKHICPANSSLLKKPDNQKVFACHSDRENIRASSSSGGLFTHLAEDILFSGGAVFGAGFGQSWRVEHGCIENIEDIFRFQGSKYVQSYIGDTFRQCRQLLKDGRRVLFSATPCQIGGLNSYLAREDTTNLTTVDLVCHGVPSPKIYAGYIAFREKEAGGNIKHVNFREKPNGWHSFGLRLKFANGKEYFCNFRQDPYIIGFLKNYYLNAACYTCKYANTERPGDITIADFWGYKDNEQLADDNKGITLVITNNAKGLSLCKKLLAGLPHTDKEMAEAAAGNAALVKPSFKHRDYDAFWADYEKLPFGQVAEKYLQPKTIKV